MPTGFGQHCGDCRRLGAAADFAELAGFVQRAAVV